MGLPILSLSEGTGLDSRAYRGPLAWLPQELPAETVKGLV